MKLAYTCLATVGLVIGFVIPSSGLANETSLEKEPAASATASNPQALEYLIGTWEVDATDPGTGQTDKIRYEVQRFVGQSWLSGVGKSEDPGFEAKDVWGHDPITKEVIRIVFDSSGTYAVVRSPGWKSGMLVLEGDARSANGIVRVRETIKQVSRDEFHATWEARRDGAWRAYALERAKRLQPK